MVVLHECVVLYAGFRSVECGHAPIVVLDPVAVDVGPAVLQLDAVVAAPLYGVVQYPGAAVYDEKPVALPAGYQGVVYYDGAVKDLDASVAVLLVGPCVTPCVRDDAFAYPGAAMHLEVVGALKVFRPYSDVLESEHGALSGPYP